MPKCIGFMQGMGTDHEIRVARLAAKRRPNPLRVDHEPLDIDELYGKAKVCLACHK